MAKFKLEFNCDNAAFDPLEGSGARINRYEVTSIMRQVIEKVERRETEGTVHDANGNAVGEWFLEE